MKKLLRHIAHLIIGGACAFIFFYVGLKEITAESFYVFAGVALFVGVFAFFAVMFEVMIWKPLFYVLDILLMGFVIACMCVPDILGNYLPWATIALLVLYAVFGVVALFQNFMSAEEIGESHFFIILLGLLKINMLLASFLIISCHATFIGKGFLSPEQNRDSGQLFQKIVIFFIGLALIFSIINLIRDIKNDKFSKDLFPKKKKTNGYLDTTVMNPKKKSNVGKNFDGDYLGLMDRLSHQIAVKFSKIEFRGKNQYSINISSYLEGNHIVYTIGADVSRSGYIGDAHEKELYRREVDDFMNEYARRVKEYTEEAFKDITVPYYIDIYYGYFDLR